jgi:DNA-binding MarR family transcriptional regulator
MPPRKPADHIDRIVDQWERERPDVDTSALALFGRLFRVTNLADSALAITFRRHDLRRGWFDLMAALRRSGPPFELNPTQLMAATMLSSGGITKRLDAMEEAGLVERRPDPADRRGTLIRLTRSGRNLADSAIEEHVGSEERLLSGLTQKERRSLDDLLRKLLQHLEQTEPRKDRA